MQSITSCLILVVVLFGLAGCAEEVTPFSFSTEIDNTERSSETDTDVDTDSDTDTDTDTDTDSDTDTDMDTDSDTDTDSDSDTDTDTDTDTDSDSDSDTDTDTDSDTDTDTDSDTDTDTDSHTDTDPSSGTETNADIPGGERIIAYRPGMRMTIDGRLDEEAWHLQEPIKRVVFGNLQDTVLFDVLWNKERFYLAVSTTDETIKKDSSVAWNDDAIEVMFDGNHDENESLDKHDDHCQFPFGDKAVYCKRDNYGEHKGGDFEVAWQRQEAGGYLMEVAMSWSYLDIRPQDGRIIGFEIGINDDDGDGGDADRDRMLRWHDDSDDWWRPSCGGDVVLIDAVEE